MLEEGISQYEKSWEISMFQAEDAWAVVELYRAIYGDFFPLKEVYDPEWHIKQLQNRDSYRVLARMAGGEIVGTGALFRSVPSNPELYEAGGVMLLEEYKSYGIALEIMNYIHKILPYQEKIGQIWGEGVCNHIFTQMMNIKSGGVPCALEIDLLPESSFKTQSKRGLDSKARVSALLIFQLFNKESQAVYLPRDYDLVLKKIYQELNLETSFIITGSEEESKLETSATIETNGEAGLSRISVNEIGEDFPVWLKRTESEMMKGGVKVLQVILPLNTPVINKAVGELKKAGYFLGGLLPRWYKHDGFLMQKTLYEPDFSKIRVYSKPGKEILELVKADYNSQKN